MNLNHFHPSHSSPLSFCLKRLYFLTFPSFSMKLIHFHLVKSLMKPDTLVPPSYDHLPRWSQSKANSHYHHHSNLYLFLSLFFPNMYLPFVLFLSLYTILYSHSLYSHFLYISSIAKRKKCFVWRSSSLNKEQNISSKPVVIIYEALCIDVAKGRMNESRNETRTHSCRFVNL